jgi:hypothetical protein
MSPVSGKRIIPARTNYSNTSILVGVDLVGQMQISLDDLPGVYYLHYVVSLTN